MNTEDLINNRLQKLAEGNDVLPTSRTTMNINQNRNLSGQPESSKVNNSSNTGNTATSGPEDKNNNYNIDNTSNQGNKSKKNGFTKAVKNKASLNESFKNNVADVNIKTNNKQV